MYGHPISYSVFIKCPQCKTVQDVRVLAGYRRMWRSCEKCNISLITDVSPSEVKVTTIKGLVANAMRPRCFWCHREFADLNGDAFDARDAHEKYCDMRPDSEKMFWE